MDVSNYNSDYTTAAAINAGAQILGAGINAYAMGDTNKKTLKQNKEIWQQNRQWAVEDYERMLRDSSPAAQMKRLEEAGLNPNLVYGSGNIQTGIVSPPRNADYPNIRQMPWQLDLAAMNALGNFLDIKLKQAQIRKTDNEADNVAEDTELTKLKQSNIALINSAQEMQNQTYEDTMDALRERPYLENYLLERNIDNISASTALLKAKLNLTEEQTKLISAQLLEVQAKIELIKAQTNLTEEQIISEMFKQDDLSASAYMKRRVGAVQGDLAAMYQSIVRLNSANSSFLERTEDYRYMQEINRLSEQASKIEVNYEEAKSIQAGTEQTKVNTGVRIVDGILDVGRVALDVLTYRQMGRNATRGRKSSTTTTHFDRRGNVTSSTKTDFNSN